MRELFGLPVLASAHGGRIDLVIYLVHLLMLILFVGWSAFFVYTVWRFRRKRHPKASYTGVQRHTSTYAEVFVVIFEVVLLVGFSIPFWAQQVNALPKPEDNPVEVRVVAQQFAWNIHYPGPDGIFGRAEAALVDEQMNPLGLDPDDPYGQDDVTTINLLHLPVDRDALIYLSTKDVIHSFALPEFRVKQDAIPGMSIPTSFRPTMTTDEFRQQVGNADRDFEIACAQLCGLGHYRMRGYVTVHTQEGFDAWLAEQVETKQATGEDDFWED
jgi:cytochrome c oxidase subunit 2